MNEYNSILCIPVRFFFNALLTKKKLTPNALRTGRGGLRAGILSTGPCHVTNGRSAGQKQQHFGNSLFCFSLQGGFSYLNFSFFSFKFSMKDGGEVKNFARVSSVFAKLMRLSSRLQLFHQFWGRPQIGRRAAGRRLLPKCLFDSST